MTAGEKFEIIAELMKSDDNLLSVKDLCEIAGVSRSGYYRWLGAADKRAERERRDEADYALILEAYNYRGYPKGARTIQMCMLHWDEPVLMNLKKIRRLMGKYGLQCPVRRANPYRRMAKALQSNRRVGNELKREFKKFGPRTVLLTDITYLPYNGTFAYLSTILDAYTRQVLAYVVSDSLEIDFVLETVELAVQQHGLELSGRTLLHSDQGCHYTSVSFQELLADKNLRQSMSRRGNCWDNAPQESFFGHMKDEIDLSGCRTFREVQAVIDDWMQYYQDERGQWDLAKLTPNEYYRYITTGEYPLEGLVEPNDRVSAAQAEANAFKVIEANMCVL